MLGFVISADEFEESAGGRHSAAHRQFNFLALVSYILYLGVVAGQTFGYISLEKLYTLKICKSLYATD